MNSLVRRNEAQGLSPFFAQDPWRTMENLMRWDPFGGMSSARAMGEAAFAPAFEAKETKEGYVIKADLPGLEEKDVNIEVLGNQLTVSGLRQTEQRNEDELYFTYERSFGSFMRSFILPDGVDADHIRADLKDGVLTINLPIRKEAQPRSISVGGLLDRVKESVKDTFSRKQKIKA